MVEFKELCIEGCKYLAIIAMAAFALSMTIELVRGFKKKSIDLDALAFKYVPKLVMCLAMSVWTNEMAMACGTMLSMFNYVGIISIATGAAIAMLITGSILKRDDNFETKE